MSSARTECGADGWPMTGRERIREPSKRRPQTCQIRRDSTRPVGIVTMAFMIISSVAWSMPLLSFRFAANASGSLRYAYAPLPETQNGLRLSRCAAARLSPRSRSCQLSISRRRWRCVARSCSRRNPASTTPGRQKARAQCGWPSTGGQAGRGAAKVVDFMTDLPSRQASFRQARHRGPETTPQTISFGFRIIISNLK